MAEPLIEFRAESAAASVIGAIAFGGGVWATMGPQKGAEFFAGYLLEQSLSGASIRCINLFRVHMPFCHTCPGRAPAPAPGRAGRKLPEAWCYAHKHCNLANGVPMHAVDNLFVFILVFSYFKTPVQYQPKVRGIPHDVAQLECRNVPAAGRALLMAWQGRGGM